VTRRQRTLRLLGYLVVWVVVVVPAWAVLFGHSHAEMVVASHDTVVRPNFDGRVQLDLGPYLPDVRSTSGGWIGVDVVVGKTTAHTAPELAVRYAAIAAHPDAEQRRVREQIGDLALDAALRAAVLGLVPIGLWLLLGPGRRSELFRRPGIRSVAAGSTALAVVVLLVVQPWHREAERVQDDTWLNVVKAFPEVSVPRELSGWEIQGGLITEGTRRLVFSLIDTYKTSKVFYRQVAARVEEVKGQLHRPAGGETVAVEVSDRHDNIGMDEVVRAAADAAGATVVLDAGDDTSTGQPWEGFSLDSLDEAFKKYDSRVAISGNHDHGTFVNRYLERRGWTHLDGKAVHPFADVRITGVDDPRSSGLGNWRDQKGLTFDEVKAQVGDDVCALDTKGERIATLIVHDANLGATALERGCTDLVLAGHLHVQKGPTRVVGANGKAGYSYTNGTTGGAAYAIAIGSKLRRDAEFTFVTYRDGRPVGLQPVTVLTTGLLSVAPYVELDLGATEKGSSTPGLPSPPSGSPQP
jgi:hypothetical protein